MGVTRYYRGIVSGVATIEATEAVASVKNVQQFRLSRPEFWHPEFFTTRQLYCTTHDFFFSRGNQHPLPLALDVEVLDKNWTEIKGSNLNN